MRTQGMADDWLAGIVLRQKVLQLISPTKTIIHVHLECSQARDCILHVYMFILIEWVLLEIKNVFFKPSIALFYLRHNVAASLNSSLLS